MVRVWFSHNACRYSFSPLHRHYLQLTPKGKTELSDFAYSAWQSEKEEYFCAPLKK
jgi:hypothetical protein